MSIPKLTKRLRSADPTKLTDGELVHAIKAVSYSNVGWQEANGRIEELKKEQENRKIQAANEKFDGGEFSRRFQ